MNVQLDSGRDLGRAYTQFMRDNSFKVERERRVIGLDLGRVQDYTAISIVEKGIALLGKWDPVWFREETQMYMAVRYLERVPRGTPYPDVVDRLDVILKNFPEEEKPSYIVVDSTGVGAPVVDMMKKAGLKTQIIPVTITGGLSVSSSGSTYYVPKRDIITNLQMLLQMGVLKLAAEMDELDALKEEMGKMEVRISPAGNEQYACWREGAHDDLVLSVGLAAWWLNSGCR
jgi:hypothetical protein